MQYIDKDSKSEDGHKITDEYLEEECKTKDPLSNEIRYINIEYAGTFTSKGFRKEMLNLGMSNQKKYCCYCLRKIGNSKSATLEHIIPQKASSTSGYDTYKELSNDEVVLTKDFISSRNQCCPPYPHTVAWNNLTVSCNGRFPLDNSVSSHCCNNARSSNYAPPVFFLQDIDSLINYMEDGSARAVLGTPYTDDIEMTIGAAKLNCQPLKEIRRLWYLLRNCKYRDIVECIYNRNNRELILCSELNLEQLSDMNLYIKYKRDSYWEVFMKYNLFYKIFQG